MKTRTCIVPTCRLAPAAKCWLFSLSLLVLFLTPVSGQSTFIRLDSRPKLVVTIVVDQFRYDYLQRFQKDYNSGFARLLREGAVFQDARYLHAYTVTAVGHSTVMSGATPSISGIIANEWFDRETKKKVTSVSDADTKVIGGVRGTIGSSPKRLLVSTVGDELKMQGGDSRVIGVSIKDRSAILPAGHTADGAYWYDEDSHHWVTSSYYREDLPDWVKAVNAQKGHERAVGAEWLPLAGTVDESHAAKPFCSMVAGTATPFCESIEATPWGNEMIEEFAEAAILGEDLGHHSAPDVLTVSFSSNDYVGHKLGPDDPAVRDISIRTDRLLGRFLDYIDHNVGLDNTLVVMTADHGVSPVPEVNEKRHMPGGRLSAEKMSLLINAALDQKFGPGAGKWLVPGASPVLPYLNQALIAARKLDPETVERIAAQAARGLPHIARVYTRHDIEQGRMQKDEIGAAIDHSYFGGRSSDLYILPEAYYLFEQAGTSHGTPYDYDTHVPLIFFGKGITAGSYARKVAINDVAPTLSSILEVATPSGSVGQILPEIVGQEGVRRLAASGNLH